MRLFTFQTIGHDITEQHEPLKDYADPQGPFYEMSYFLNWPFWIWTFPRITDFMEDVTLKWLSWKPDNSFWVLDIPDELIKFCGLNAQCEGEPVEFLFKEHPEMIRENGDIPMGLVKLPIQKEWVVIVL